jgi:altronate dehydratase large subunit
MTAADLVVGTICDGSDATGGLTADPAMGIAFDTLVVVGGPAGLPHVA